MALSGEQRKRLMAVLEGLRADLQRLEGLLAFREVHDFLKVRVPIVRFAALEYVVQDAERRLEALVEELAGKGSPDA